MDSYEQHWCKAADIDVTDVPDTFGCTTLYQPKVKAHPAGGKEPL
jgi:hypothetical protein